MYATTQRLEIEVLFLYKNHLSQGGHVLFLLGPPGSKFENWQKRGFISVQILHIVKEMYFSDSPCLGLNAGTQWTIVTYSKMYI